MEQVRLQLADLAHLWPELTIVFVAVALTVIDLVFPRSANRSFLGWLSLAGVLASLILVCFQLNLELPVQLLNQSYRVDDFAGLIKLVLLGSTALIILMSLGSLNTGDIPHTGEYYYLLLPATLGGMVMASSGDLITLFVGLELLSITSYILVGMRKKNTNSNEAAFKYVVLGGVSSAVILYGMSFLYGITGSTNLRQISAALPDASTAMLPLLYVAFFLLLAGLGFKIAAAPFHMWAPDVYQGAPTPIAAYLAVVSKAAGFAMLFRIIYGMFGVEAIKVLFNQPSGAELANMTKDVSLSLMVLAAIAMVIGNVTALRQTNMKRLLALSGVANAGYLLVPIANQFAILHYANFSEFIYYLTAYALMNIGMFAVIILMEQSNGHEELSGFAGLYYRAPFTAAAVVLLVLSLTGIPVTAGFFGKVYIMLGTVQTYHYWLAAIMIVTSVISFYYYFGLIRQMFMRSDDRPSEVKVPFLLGLTCWLCAAASVLLGLFPQTMLRFIETIFTYQKDLFIL